MLSLTRFSLGNGN